MLRSDNFVRIKVKIFLFGNGFGVIFAPLPMFLLFFKGKRVKL